VVNRQLSGSLGWEERGSEDFAPVFSLLVVAVSKEGIDPPLVDLSLLHRKKSRDAKESKEKKEKKKVLGKDEGRDEEKSTRGVRRSQRKMDFREVRAGLNSRKMSSE